MIFISLSGLFIFEQPSYAVTASKTNCLKKKRLNTYNLEGTGLLEEDKQASDNKAKTFQPDDKAKEKKCKNFQRNQF